MTRTIGAPISDPTVANEERRLHIEFHPISEEIMDPYLRPQG
jgi:hypothetical protein